MTFVGCRLQRPGQKLVCSFSGLRSNLKTKPFRALLVESIMRVCMYMFMYMFMYMCIYVYIVYSIFGVNMALVADMALI